MIALGPSHHRPDVEPQSAGTRAAGRFRAGRRPRSAPADGRRVRAADSNSPTWRTSVAATAAPSPPPASCRASPASTPGALDITSAPARRSGKAKEGATGRRWHAAVQFLLNRAGLERRRLNLSGNSGIILRGCMLCYYRQRWIDNETGDVLFARQREPSGALGAHEAVACAVAAAERWRAGKRVLIACEAGAGPAAGRSAVAREPRNSCPHNGRRRAALRRRWNCAGPARGNTPRDLLIALLPQFADFATAFHEVVDFVPYEDTLKQLARDRYKAYHSVGFIDHGYAANSLNTIKNGKDKQSARHRIRPKTDRTEAVRSLRIRVTSSRTATPAGKLLHHDPAAERHRQPAHGPRVPADHHGHHDSLSSACRVKTPCGRGHRPRRHRHPDGGRAQDRRGRRQNPPRLRP